LAVKFLPGLLQEFIEYDEKKQKRIPKATEFQVTVT